MTKLSVNVDHVATLRQARGVSYPDPVAAASIAENRGAHGITVHLRADRRHIQEKDVRRLRQKVRGKLNLELATSDEMISLAVDLAPHQVTLVPERPDEVTTEGGLDLVIHGDRVEHAAAKLVAAGISVSVFLDPDLGQIEQLAGLSSSLVPGLEINTDSYSQVSGQAAADELARIVDCALLGTSLGLKVFAGHGLTVSNVGALAAVPEIEEFNIGHSIVSRAVLIGMDAAVGEMLAAIDAGRPS